MIYIAAIVLVSLLIAVSLTPAYNRFIALRNRAEQAFSTVDVMLKRRYDLVPNLVACVAGYASHERQTLAELTALRAWAISGGLSQDETLDIGNQMGRQLNRILVTVERYPQIRASDNFMQLQRSLNEVEEQVAAARRTFNAAVTNYNNAVQTFPANLVAGIFGFRLRRLFEAVEPERRAPDVRALAKA